MNKSIVLQSIAVILLLVNILRLDFDNLSSMSANSLQLINASIALVMLVVLLLKESEEVKKTEPKGRAFGKRKDL